MMGQSGYRWMMGGATAPGWMTGGSLPGFMTGTDPDMGKVMGSLFADAPGAPISPAQAATLGDQVRAGATVDRAANRITFTTKTVRFTVLASPAAGPDETFRIAGLVNPTIVMPEGAKVTVGVINADSDTAHGLVVGGSGAFRLVLHADDDRTRPVGRVVPGQSHLGGHARRDFLLHRQRHGHVPVPLPGTWPRPKGHGRHPDRELIPSRR
jgi:hypothetical protein